MRTKLLIAQLTGLMLCACSSVPTPTHLIEPEGIVTVASEAPISFAVPPGWTVTNEDMATILTFPDDTGAAYTIAIQPFASAGQSLGDGIGLIKRAFAPIPTVARFSMGPSAPAILDGAPALDYRTGFNYLDVPMHRYGIITVIDDLLIDISITAEVTNTITAEFALDQFLQAVTLPSSARTIGPKGIGTDSRL